MKTYRAEKIRRNRLGFYKKKPAKFTAESIWWALEVKCIKPMGNNYTKGNIYEVTTEDGGVYIIDNNGDPRYWITDGDLGERLITDYFRPV
jgi:hypothetical protein